MTRTRRKAVSEVVAGETYEYVPLGKHIVSATGVCDGQPTFKYTRIAAHHAVELIAGGRSIQDVAGAYRVPPEAIEEALALASQILARPSF